MSKLDSALARMDAALGRLEKAVDAVSEEPGEDELDAVRAERDELSEEVKALRAQTEEDARLRLEAAEAVRAALNDLRGAVDEGVAANA